MAFSFYEVLGVSRIASDSEIKEAYNNKIRQISRAYEVLKTKETRAAYDAGLRHGDSSPSSFVGSTFSTNIFSGWTSPQIVDGTPKPGISFSKSADPSPASAKPSFSFSKSTTDPSPAGVSPAESFQLFGSPGIESPFGSIVTKPVVGQEASPPPEHVNEVGFIQVSLEEIYSGVNKKVSFRSYRSFARMEGSIQVHSSWKAGTKVPPPASVTGFGVSSKLMIRIEEEPHSHFVRAGDDLVHVLKAASFRTNPEMRIKTLSGRSIPVKSFSSTIAEGSRQLSLIPGEGMPKWKDGVEAGKGDLIVKWEF